MAKKSEAPKLVRRFIASFNGKVNAQSRTMTQMVGALHTDNAGELVSREFQELMDAESVEHTTSPPHVHQLNGVAERAIRSVSELARSYLVSGQVPVKFYVEMPTLNVLGLFVVLGIVGQVAGRLIVGGQSRRRHQLRRRCRPQPELVEEAAQKYTLFRFAASALRCRHAPVGRGRTVGTLTTGEKVGWSWPRRSQRT